MPERITRADGCTIAALSRDVTASGHYVSKKRTGGPRLQAMFGRTYYGVVFFVADTGRQDEVQCFTLYTRAVEDGTFRVSLGTTID